MIYSNYSVRQVMLKISLKVSCQRNQFTRCPDSIFGVTHTNQSDAFEVWVCCSCYRLEFSRRHNRCRGVKGVKRGRIGGMRKGKRMAVKQPERRYGQRGQAEDGVKEKREAREVLKSSLEIKFKKRARAQGGNKTANTNGRRGDSASG